VLVVVLDQRASGGEVHASILEVEVSTHRDNNVVATVILLLIYDPLVELLSFRRGVICRQFLIDDKGVIGVKCIKAEVWWSPVHRIKGRRKYLDAVT